MQHMGAGRVASGRVSVCGGEGGGGDEGYGHGWVLTVTVALTLGERVARMPLAAKSSFSHLSASML